MHDFNEMSSPLDVFEKVMELDKLVIVTETNRYAQQNGRNFVMNAAEMKAFLGMNYIMGVNMLPTIHHYWESDDYVEDYYEGLPWHELYNGCQHASNHSSLLGK